MGITEETERSDAEQALIRHAIKASWRTLRLESPTPTEVEESVRRILRAEAGE